MARGATAHKSGQSLTEQLWQLFLALVFYLNNFHDSGFDHVEQIYILDMFGLPLSLEIFLEFIHNDREIRSF